MLKNTYLYTCVLKKSQHIRTKTNNCVLTKFVSVFFLVVCINTILIIYYCLLICIKNN